MDKIAKLSAEERYQIFYNTSVKMRIPAAMVEKDFWVCWTLSKLFADTELTRILRFKGGTSLSKGYKLIERFSEDIDIILDKRKILGDEDLFKSSYKQQKKFDNEISVLAAEYISTVLKDKVVAVLGDIVQVYTHEEYQKDKFGRVSDFKEIDNSSLHIIYPKTSADEYLRPDVLLEIGIMSAWIPNELREILPYIADIYPQLEIAPAIVPTIKATRTFWDKATILHREFHRPENTHTPARYSRHYYDLYKMAQSAVKDSALADFDLLSDVVDRKDKLYHCAWAKYEDCMTGKIHLLPNNNNGDLLRRDYETMQGMIFGSLLEWDTILSGLMNLEIEINMQK